MSGETEKQISGWTVDTLKEYVEQRFMDQDKAVQAALLAAKEAVLKAEVASEKRFEGVNEFRKTLSDQTATFLTRNEYSGRHQAVVDKIDALTLRISATEGEKKGSDVTIGKIYAAIGVVGAVLGIIVLLANSVFK